MFWTNLIKLSGQRIYLSNEDFPENDMQIYKKVDLLPTKYVIQHINLQVYNVSSREGFTRKNLGISGKVSIKSTPKGITGRGLSQVHPLSSPQGT